MMIKWLGKGGLWGEALRILQDAEEASSSSGGNNNRASGGGGEASRLVTVTMYREALRACAAAGRGQEARAILTAMIAKR